MAASTWSTTSAIHSRDATPRGDLRRAKRPAAPATFGVCSDCRTDHRLPVRPGRRADPDRDGAQRGLDRDVRRLPARARRPGPGEPFVPFDPGEDYNSYVDGRPRADGVRTFLASRGIELPEGAPDDPPDRGDGATGWATARTRSCCGSSGSGASRCTRARWRTCARPGRPAWAARSSRPAPTAARCCGPPGSRTCSRSWSTAWSPPREGLRGKPSPDTFLAAAARLGRRRRRAAAVFEDAVAGVRAGPGRRVRVRRRRRPGRPRRRAAAARSVHCGHRPRRSAA